MATVGTAAQLHIEGDTVTYVSPEGQTHTLPLGDLLARAQEHLLQTDVGIVPQDVIGVVRRRRRTMWIGQIASSVHAVKWIRDDSEAPFGPETKYGRYVIALPYVIVFAVFDGGMLTSANECFFRTEPLKSMDDELLYPALLNVSSFRGKPDEAEKPLCWICDQHLDRSAISRRSAPGHQMHVGWQLLTETLLDSAFNRSSEHHEGSSWFAESSGVDPRIASIDAWAAATQQDPLFVLDVPFLPTGLTVAAVVERIFGRMRSRPSPDEAAAATPSTTTPTADDLARLMVNPPRMPRRPR